MCFEKFRVVFNDKFTYSFVCFNNYVIDWYVSEIYHFNR